MSLCSHLLLEGKEQSSCGQYQDCSKALWHAILQVMRRCNTVRALFPFPITQAPGDLLEAPLQEGLQHARDQGLCSPGCRVVVMAENLADGPDTLPVLFTRVCSSATPYDSLLSSYHCYVTCPYLLLSCGTNLASIWSLACLSSNTSIQSNQAHADAIHTTVTVWFNKTPQSTAGCKASLLPHSVKFRFSHSRL